MDQESMFLSIVTIFVLLLTETPIRTSFQNALEVVLLKM